MHERSCIVTFDSYYASYNYSSVWLAIIPEYVVTIHASGYDHYILILRG